MFRRLALARIQACKKIHGSFILGTRVQTLTLVNSPPCK